jgi:hypothetical protein
MSEARPKQAEGQQFLGDYQTVFTTRADGSSWPKHERTWLNVGRYFGGLLRPGSYNTVTDIADKMHIDQERLERFIKRKENTRAFRHEMNPTTPPQPSVRWQAEYSTVLKPSLYKRHEYKRLYRRSECWKSIAPIKRKSLTTHR